jgi:hypothetical protein
LLITQLRELLQSMAKKKSKIQKPRLPLLSLLILECDTNKLASQRLSVAQDLHNIVRIMPKKFSVEVALIRSKQDMVDNFADYTQSIVALSWFSPQQ